MTGMLLRIIPLMHVGHAPVWQLLATQRPHSLFTHCCCHLLDANAAQEHVSALQRSIETIKQELSKLLGACAYRHVDHVHVSSNLHSEGQR